MKVLVTGSSGLIGSEAVLYFAGQGHAVYGMDNNMRMDFFGPQGDTRPTRDRLVASVPSFVHREVDIRDRALVMKFFEEVPVDFVIHCAAQPSHDLARDRPFDDFEVNALATLNLLEAVRRHRPETPFAFMSTNKVYGDAPNERPLVEQATRWEYADPADREGVDE